MSPHTAHTIVSGGLYACHARYPFTASNHTEHSRQEASIHTDARQFTDRTRWVYPPQRRDQTKPALSATRDGSNREPRRRTQAILYVPLPYLPPIDPPSSLLINPPLAACDYISVLCNYAHTNVAGNCVYMTRWTRVTASHQTKTQQTLFEAGHCFTH